MKSKVRLDERRPVTVHAGKTFEGVGVQTGIARPPNRRAEAPPPDQTMRRGPLAPPHRGVARTRGGP